MTSATELIKRFHFAIDALARGESVDQEIETLIGLARTTSLEPEDEAHVLDDQAIVAGSPALRREVRRLEANVERDSATKLSVASGAALELREQRALSMTNVDDYDVLLADEVNLIGPMLHSKSERAKIAFVGAGPMPMSAILLRRALGRPTMAIERDIDSVRLAEEVLRCCDLRGEIEMVYSQGRDADLESVEFVHMASLTEGKLDVAKHAVQQGVPLVAIRSGHRLCRLLYEPIDVSEFVALGLELIAATTPRPGVRYQTFVFANA